MGGLVPPSMTHGLYVFLIMLGLGGIVALHWEIIYSRLTAKSRELKAINEDIEQAYLKLRVVCEPGTLDPRRRGNPIFMRSDARDFINPIRTRLIKTGLKPPETCTNGLEIQEKWFKYLGELRSK